MNESVNKSVNASVNVASEAGAGRTEQRDREDFSVIEELRRQRKPGRTCNARPLSTVDSATGRLVRFILRAELLLPPSYPLPCPGCRERPAARLTHEQLDQAQVSLA